MCNFKRTILCSAIYYTYLKLEYKRESRKKITKSIVFVILISHIWFMSIDKFVFIALYSKFLLWLTEWTQKNSIIMATTVQKPPHPSQMDPRMRRAVYAKYREMLVSKHNQANEMIKQLPAYMVREDRGFNTMNVIVNEWVY